MDTCIRQRHNTFVQYIATQLLLDLCKATERENGTGVGMRWWEKVGVDLDRTRETAETAAEADVEGLEDLTRGGSGIPPEMGQG